MSRPFAPVLAASLVAIVFAACSGTGMVAPSGSPAPTPRPTPTPVPVPSAAPTRSPDSGDVVGTYPELTIEAGEAGELAVTVTDPEARAWRLTAAGTGARAGDRLEVVVETGDIVASVLVHEYRDGTLADVVDLTGTLDGTQGAAGGCHGTLPVCISSDGIRLPADGDGTLSVRLELPEALPLSITGATAGWPGEPFELGGPWEQTLPFVWPQG
jgi:hypothetical protein